jgi:hypothetical protein
MFNDFLEMFLAHIDHFIHAVPSEMKERGFTEKDRSNYGWPITNVYY